MLNKKPRILYFDIETSPCLVYAWGLGKQVVGIKQLKKDRKIISIGYMFEGDKKVKILKMDLKKHKPYAFDDDADKKMLIEFVKVYNSADLVVAHNGRRFDRARIRARLVKFNLPDLRNIPFDDSYGMTKDIDFTSHKLDYIGKYLGTGQKDEIGYSAWTAIMEGSKKALNEMCSYMKTDVIRLRDAYQKLKPYSKSKLNMAIFSEQGHICHNCGSSKLQARGYMTTTTGKFQQFQCQSCHSWGHVGKNLIKKSSEYQR